MQTNHIYHGHCLDILKTLPENSIDCCVTSPPYYGLRDYGVSGQIGLEETPEMFVQQLVQVFNEVNRVLKPTGTLWLNIGDSYAGGGGGNYNKTGISNAGGQHITNVRNKQTWLNGNNLKPKDLIGIPWMLAFALRNAGWYLRQEIIWHKPNPMPESVTDRCTKAHEQIFLLTKRAKYYFDSEAIKQPVADSTANDKRLYDEKYKAPTIDVNFPGGKIRGNGLLKSNVGQTKANKRSVWTVTTSPYKDAHFATFPENLIVDCILAGTSAHGCCAACGKPYERILEKTGSSKLRNGAQEKAKKVIVQMRGETSLNTSMHLTNELPIYETTGWQATCHCSASVVPCTVLDPFSGAGTTAVVAKKLHRQYIGIELNQQYINLTHKRLHKELGIFQ